ncbi:MAG: hypothetical protein O3C40_13245 [Planctomycetota bacterium]|nr:hypothetical protein [Planctomycetota bacterium]
MTPLHVKTPAGTVLVSIDQIRVRCHYLDVWNEAGTNLFEFSTLQRLRSDALRGVCGCQCDDTICQTFCQTFVLTDHPRLNGQRLLASQPLHIFFQFHYGRWRRFSIYQDKTSNG